MMLTMDPKSSEKAVMARREIITRRVHIHNYYVGVRFDYWYRDEKEASSSTMARNENSAILSVGVRQPAQKIGGLTMTNRERQEINETARAVVTCFRLFLMFCVFRGCSKHSHPQNLLGRNLLLSGTFRSIVTGLENAIKKLVLRRTYTASQTVSTVWPESTLVGLASFVHCVD